MSYDEFVKTQKLLLEKDRLLLNESKFEEFAIIMDSLAQLENFYTQEYIVNRNQDN